MKSPPISTNAQTSSMINNLDTVSIVSDSTDLLYLSLDVQLPLKQNIDEVEKQIILKALSLHQNSKTKTAVALDITREGLYKKLTKLGIDLSKSGDEV
jgi:DNA-binding NtrC family response regulator